MQPQIATHLSLGRLASETINYGWSSPAYSPAGGRLKPVHGAEAARRRPRRMWSIRWILRRLAQLASWAR